MMICPKCGNQLNDGAAFCPKCGNKIESNTINNVPNQSMTNNAVTNTVATGNTQKKPKTWKVVLLTVAATIVAGFVGLIAIGSKSTDTSTQNVITSEEVPEIQPGEGSNTPVTSEAGALDELLGYIDQAEELVSGAYNDVQAISDSEEGPEKLRKQADVLANSLSALSDLQKQADAVSGIDANLENAMTEYFNMVNDSQKAYYEMQVFFADYFDLFGSVLMSRPQTVDYVSITDYYNELYAWYEKAKEGYVAVDSCPSCLESEWKQYGETLDLNYYIVDKLYWAEQYKDELRQLSAREMSNRYEIVEEQQFNEFLECLSDEAIFFQNQRNAASKLAEEIHSYAELGEGERSGYEFEYVPTGKITLSLSYDAVDTIYPSLYNTYDAFVIVKTGCLSGNKKIVVEAEIPGFTQNYKESFALDSSYRAIYIKPPALTGDLDLSSAKDAQINVTVSEQDGTLIEAKTFPLTIKSKYDVEWYTDEYGVATKDNILCYLTPEASAISQLKRQAIEEISSMTGGRLEAFVGYQGNPYDDPYVGTYLQAAGIMRAMYEMGVRYNMDPFSISSGNQHILFPEDVLGQQSGLCIETSLVVASALQSAGMHAFLVLPPDHAQVAVEIWPGTGEYFLIETTSLEAASNNQSIFVKYAKAILEDEVLEKNFPIAYLNKEEWRNYLSVDGTYIIDCDDSSLLGLTPFAN